MPLPVVALPAVLSAVMAQLVLVLGVVGFQVLLKVLVLVGFGTVTITGFDSILGSVIDILQDNIQGLPSQALAIMSIMKVDKGMTIVLSSYIVAAGFRGVNSVTKPFMSRSV